MLKLAVLLLELIDVGGFDGVAHYQALSKLVDGGNLLASKVFEVLGRIAAFVAHLLNLKRVLQLCPLLLQLVVVVLKDLDELAEVLNLLTVEQFDFLDINAEIFWRADHLAQSAVFCGEVFDEVGQLVVLSHRLGVHLLH